MLYGCDISRFQDDASTPTRINFKKMVEENITFIGIRCLFGTTKDRDFDYNWKAAADAGLYRTAYHFVTIESIQSQVDILLKILANDKGELPVTHDYETYESSAGKWSTPKIGNLKWCAQQVAKEHNRLGIVYTGYYTWRDYGGWNDVYWKRHPLWIATYGSTPLIPMPWTDYTFWQYTDKGDGKKYGVESKNIDLDLFNGNLEDLKNVGKMSDNITPPVSNSTFKYKTLYDSMRVRENPNTSSKIIRTIPRGTVINALDFGGNDVWIYNGEGWICMKQYSNIYLERSE